MPSVVLAEGLQRETDVSFGIHNALQTMRTVMGVLLAMVEDSCIRRGDAAVRSTHACVNIFTETSGGGFMCVVTGS